MYPPAHLVGQSQCYVRKEEFKKDAKVHMCSLVEHCCNKMMMVVRKTIEKSAIIGDDLLVTVKENEYSLRMVEHNVLQYK